MSDLQMGGGRSWLGAIWEREEWSVSSRGVTRQQGGR